MEESTVNEDTPIDRPNNMPTIEEMKKAIDMILQSYFDYDNRNQQNKKE